jgi:hypothetical protein
MNANLTAFPGCWISTSMLERQRLSQNRELLLDSRPFFLPQNANYIEV